MTSAAWPLLRCSRVGTTTGTGAWERAHHAFLRAGDVPAVRCAFWLGFGLLLRGEMARGGGWVARAQRQLEACAQDCVEQGYVLFPVGFQRLMTGDLVGAHATFAEVAEIADRFVDPDLEALGRHAQDRALLRMGETSEGTRLLDEAMVAVTVGETSPMVAGIVYCSVVEACREVFDVAARAGVDHGTGRVVRGPARRRALPRAVPGAPVAAVPAALEWRQALDEVERARGRLSDPPGQPALGMAYYQLAELRRLRRAARSAADELADFAEELAAPLLEATAAHALGAVLLSEGDARAALTTLRRAWTRSWELEAPYETARVRVPIGVACQRLGDADSAETEWRSARRTFEELDATPDVKRIDALCAPPAEAPDGLTERELEVLALVAAGKADREIAGELVISENTVRRHLQKILMKAALTSRAAATAYAFEHGLVSRRTRSDGGRQAAKGRH